MIRALLIFALLLTGCATGGSYSSPKDRAEIARQWPRYAGVVVGSLVGISMAQRQRDAHPGQSVPGELYATTGALLGYGLVWGLQWSWAQINHDKTMQQDLSLELDGDVMNANYHPYTWRYILGWTLGAAVGGILGYQALSLVPQNSDGEEQAIVDAFRPATSVVGAVAGAGLGIWIASLTLDTPAKGPSAAGVAAPTQVELLAEARQLEAEGQLRKAWGAYRKAKDLGGEDPVIDAKLLDLEQRLRESKQ